MRKLLPASLVLLGCWTASKSAGPQEPAADTSAGGATYGGVAYGGATYAAIAAQIAALSQPGSVASLTGTGDLSGVLDDPDVYGNLLGDSAGGSSAYGVGGTGSGQGGGGTGWGTIGTGRYGTIGHGSGGSGFGGSGYGLRGRANPPKVQLGTPSAASPALDAAIIRRYIKRNLMKIRYCYEKELVAAPSLAGAMKIQFTIGADGNVSSASASGMPPVDACVAAVIRAIQFPKPIGGGSVIVTYPFTFSNADATGATP